MERSSMRVLSAVVVPGLLVLLLSFSCDQDGGPGPLSDEVYACLARTGGTHPRLLLTREKAEELTDKIEGSHHWLWTRYLEDLPEKLATAAEPVENLGRNHGNLAADLAFAWRLTGQDSLFSQARDYLLSLCRQDVWDPDYDLLHGHLLLGAALAYDWLYPDLSRAQRSLVARRLGEEAQAQYRRVAHERAWYRNQYLQNHGFVNLLGLAYAAVALYGEDARAQAWLAECIKFFDQVFRLAPVDGSSVEGLSYGNYGMEFALYFAELARTVLGLDYYYCRWVREYPQYLLHSLLPRISEREWAMAFGDNPRHGNYHGPEPHLFLIASRFRDRSAQWLGKRLIKLRPAGLASASWLSILWYDPEIGEKGPQGTPTLKHFTDLGQVMMRSAWADTNAVLIGLKCGPFMGRARTQDTDYDLGAGHAHPDAGSFQVYAFGRFLAVDPMYTYFKSSANHNTLLVKGQGQLGQGEAWFAGAEALYFKHDPLIIETRSTGQYDYVLADLAGAYHPALNLDRALRHFLFIKPDILLIADELTLGARGALFSYPADTLELEGTLRVSSDYSGYVAGTRGLASFSFPGPPGEYDISVSYLDNIPRSGSYFLIVDGDTVHTWQDTIEVTDTHLEVARQVALSDSSRISFCARPMGEGARLVKMAVYSSRAPAVRRVQWLLNFEPLAEVTQKSSRFEACIGQACLDVYPLAPARRSRLGLHQVKKARQMKQTMQLVIEPVFPDSSTTVLTLLHARRTGTRPLKWIRSRIYQDTATLSWIRDNKQVAMTLNLRKRQIDIKSKMLREQ
ncbi:MAG: DUF4962 domain-containing protein [Gemmatimonadota bacterium]|nr:DUF4962 domain-containing protein [Gemmatimonadota bacterium]